MFGCNLQQFVVEILPVLTASLSPVCLSVPLQSLMDQYFGRMRSLMNNKELPARIRFLLQDTVELRENNWVPRKAFIDNGPKLINQIRQDAVKVSLGPSLGLVCPHRSSLII